MFDNSLIFARKYAKYGIASSARRDLSGVSIFLTGVLELVGEAGFKREQPSDGIGRPVGLELAYLRNMKVVVSTSLAALIWLLVVASL